MHLQENTKTEEKVKIKLPSKYKVLMHNDDYTSMEFVIEILVDIFKKSPQESTKIMYDVHKRGIGVAGIYTYDIAKTKSIEAMNRAEDEGFPFTMTLEEV